MRHLSTTLLGKSIQTAAKLRGGGSALPGLIIEKIDPDFIKRTLDKLPYGVVVISGTNGKTTTTKMVVELLEGQGLRVFTNRTGSNFVRGVAAALLESISLTGNLQADIAVLELDEAHAVHFVRVIPPRYSLLLNVMRDQLDRFGEIDTTARLLETTARATTEKVIVNREDPRLATIATSLPENKVSYFGLGSSARDSFPNDDDLHSTAEPNNTSLSAVCVLEKLDGKTGEFTLLDHRFSCQLTLEGIYNVFNASAALGLVASIVSPLDMPKLKETLAGITPAFGRGETIIVHGQPLELVLVKNPGGFQLGLTSFTSNGYATMIAINDNYADGRDMSWLWDVDFSSLRANGVAFLSGVRAYDMALRLEHDDVSFDTIEPNLTSALNIFLETQPGPKRIYCTYTAMLALRRSLAKITEIEGVL